MKKAWYILNYHNISWEENMFLSGIGGSFPPDVFYEQVDMLHREGSLISVQEGFELWKENKIDRPLISFWFDDGFSGVRKYAKPVMDEFDVTGALSINSKFFLGKEMHWRCLLSFLKNVDGLRFLRHRLKKYGYSLDQSIRNFTMDKFSPEIVQEINKVYESFTTPEFRQDSYRIFENKEGLNSLLQNGWIIANHSASHYPVSEDIFIEEFENEFLNCEGDILNHLNISTNFWVLPFDRNTNHKKVIQKFNDLDENERFLVFVGEKANKTLSKDRILHRIGAPSLRGKSFAKYLSKRAIS